VPKEASYASIAPSIKTNLKKIKGFWFATLSVVGLISLAGLRRKKINS
jgi:hypothetical protein